MMHPQSIIVIYLLIILEPKPSYTIYKIKLLCLILNYNKFPLLPVQLKMPQQKFL